ncbi:MULTISPECIES: VOC family protein [Methanocorpusculum]|jgi:lactoylglutathione lyase|uniref:Lactoylglutathione lyase n=1 Tax=Methanocorpusculum parvum TaxID=2193 RepID=A0AAX0Q7D2_9EURY|nr:MULTISPECIES: VOC family protein [Methanocorpusculum]MDY3203429.1 VOC family protein [Methanocorpusculum sp.]NLC91069.1 lactoylglutathione lyase [Methanocorpusculum parvum]PAV09270.1 lactoylglutathione lyase [Methanocorpusculum parvum]HJJ37123.1 VOC family protein [Methanocorpusculum sp.]
MQFQMIHNNINVLDLDRSMKFYAEALGLFEVKRIVPESGDVRIVFLGDGQSNHKLELTQITGRTNPYEPGDNGRHLAFSTDDFQGSLEKHQKMGCVKSVNKASGIYYLEDPDGYTIEILPLGRG